MKEKTIGGISFADVVAFQLRIMFGENNFAKIREATKEEDIILVCLRLASNDAFRHVSLNHFSTEAEAKQFITDKNVKTMDEYLFKEVLPIIKDVYLDYVHCKSAEDKHDTLKKHISKVCEAYKEIKVIDNSDKALCFGHFQKLFNMATKNYLCIYMCREQLETVFSKELPIGERINEQDMACADCPVDSYILSALDSAPKNSSVEKLEGFKKYTDVKWSKLGSDRYPTSLYITIQEAIATQHDNDKSNLYYDFKKWNIR